MKQIKKILLICSILFHAAFSDVVSASSGDAASAVILMYHHVASDTPESTSVTPEKFKQHMQYLADNNYTVWPLIKTLRHLASGKRIPPRTVAITFDDAYQSVYTEALPVLKAKAWPFTVFVTTKYITDGYTNFMSWQQLREISMYGGDVGNHSLSHPHFIRNSNGETHEQWRKRITTEVQLAQATLRKYIANPIWVLAYPYGEYSLEVTQLIRELGYFGIGQSSGAVSVSSNFQSVPRFPIATGFDGIEDFAIKVAARNLPVTILSPKDGVISGNAAAPVLRLRLGAGEYKKSALRCYASGQGQIKLEWTDESDVVNVQANADIQSGRTKYNCTAPSVHDAAVFYWFSFLWMKREMDGSWYQE